MFNWFSFLTYAVVSGITPGPNNIMSLSNGSRRGFKKSLPFNLGVWLGLSVVILICVVFCSVLSELIPTIKLPLLIAGAAYMLYLAWKTFRSTGEIEETSTRSSFLSGLLLQFINPKIYICIIISLEAYILPAFSGKPLFIVGCALLQGTIAFLSTLCWSAFGSVFKQLFSKYAKVINTIMALLLVYCAVSFFL